MIFHLRDKWGTNFPFIINLLVALIIILIILSGVQSDQKIIIQYSEQNESPQLITYSIDFTGKELLRDINSIKMEFDQAIENYPGIDYNHSKQLAYFTSSILLNNESIENSGFYFVDQNHCEEIIENSSLQAKLININPELVTTNNITISSNSIADDFNFNLTNIEFSSVFPNILYAVRPNSPSDTGIILPMPDDIPILFENENRWKLNFLVDITNEYLKSFTKIDQIGVYSFDLINQFELLLLDFFSEENYQLSLFQNLHSIKDNLYQNMLESILYIFPLILGLQIFIILYISRFLQAQYSRYQLLFTRGLSKRKMKNNLRAESS